MDTNIGQNSCRRVDPSVRHVGHRQGSGWRKNGSHTELQYSATQANTKGMLGVVDSLSDGAIRMRLTDRTLVTFHKVHSQVVIGRSNISLKRVHFPLDLACATTVHDNITGAHRGPDCDKCRPTMGTSNVVQVQVNNNLVGVFVYNWP